MQILTFHNTERFAEAAKSLRQTLEVWGWQDRLIQSTELPPGCPPHAESPFAFKPWLIEQCRKLGVDQLLWADSSIRFMQSPLWIERELKRTGILMIEDSDQFLRWWSSDRSLDHFGIERRSLGDRRCALAGLIGFDLRRPKALEFLHAWLETERKGLFQGKWSNEDLTVSSDPEVKGHRHDQTLATLVAWNLGIEMIPHHDAGVFSWSDHAMHCDSARIIVDRSGSCPQVMRLIAKLPRQRVSSISMSETLEA